MKRPDSSESQEPVLSPMETDFYVNKLFQALTQCLGRPFKVNSPRNLRSIVKQWDPLLKDTTSMECSEFKASYLASHFFDRYFYASEVDTAQKLEVEAWESFEQNLLRGEYWNAVIQGTSGFSELGRILETAHMKIQSVLGPSPDLERVFELCGHGPNSTVGVRRENAYHGTKTVTFDQTVAIKRDVMPLYLEFAVRFAQDIFGTDDHVQGFLDSEFALVDGNNLLFVPKKFDRLRVIQCEPTWNAFFQLGTGRLIEELMRPFGIDLSSQPDVHRNLARLASAYPEVEMATIDWREASNRHWVELIRRLVPNAWFKWFMTLRSPVTRYKRGTYALPMIGTMGNGFTFPLQTLVFWAILTAICEIEGIPPYLTVFGDDCIVPSAVVPAVIKFAGQVGWELNKEKSFADGWFRESCGCDSFRGVECRPIFVERPRDATSKHGVQSWAYTLVNAFVQRLGGESSDDIVFWLLDLFAEKNLGKVFVVPPRESDASGLRSPDPRNFAEAVDFFEVPHLKIQEGFEWVTNPDFSRSRVPFTGTPVWTYKRLEVLAPKDEVGDETPYYHLGLGVQAPANFGEEHILTSRYNPGIPPDVWDRPAFNGCVIRRTAIPRYRVNRSQVHSWTYWLDPLHQQPLPLV